MKSSQRTEGAKDARRPYFLKTSRTISWRVPVGATAGGAGPLEIGTAGYAGWTTRWTG